MKINLKQLLTVRKLYDLAPNAIQIIPYIEIQKEKTDILRDMPEWVRHGQRME